VRPQQEILDRVRALNLGPPADDFLGFRREVLIGALGYEHAKAWLKDDVTVEAWQPLTTDEEVLGAAAGYLVFAWEKAVGHRGISANRSVSKLAEYAWLLGRDDLVEQMDAAPYPQYGVPKLVVVAEGLGLSLPLGGDLDALARMARGLPCRPGCDEGCGR